MERLLLSIEKILVDLLVVITKLLSYSKKTTPFNLIAREKGVEKCLDGIGMLVHQAAFSFEIWTGKSPDTKAVLKDLRATF